MNQNTKMVLGLLAVGAVAYFLWEKSKKDAAADLAEKTPAPVNPPVSTLPVDPIVPIDTAPVTQAAPTSNFNAMTPIFKDYAGDPAGFFSTEKVKLNY